MTEAERFLSDICPYCGSPRNRVARLGRDQLFDRGPRRFAAIACSSCGGWFTRGSDFSSLDEFFAVSYPAAYYAEASGGMSGDLGSNPVVGDHLRESVDDPHGMRVLDIGSGNGGFMVHLRALGFTPEGVEISETAAHYCRENYQIPVTTGRVEDLRPDHPFAAATMVGVLEHMLNPLRTLEAVRAILAPGGLLVLDLPDIASLEAKIARDRWWALDLPRHTIHCTRKTASHLLRDAGFEVLRSSSIVKTWFHMGYLKPPVYDGIPRGGLRELAIKAVASLFLLARQSPHFILVCRRS